MTEELKVRFAQVGDQDIADPIVIAKWFTPWTRWTWYGIAYDPQDKICFGLVVGFETELGYFSIEELEEIRGPHGLRIERDLYWKEKRLSEVREGHHDSRHL